MQQIKRTERERLSALTRDNDREAARLKELDERHKRDMQHLSDLSARYAIVAMRMKGRSDD